MELLDTLKMRILLKKMTCDAIVSFQELYFFLSIVFGALCSSLVSDWSYSSLLQERVNRF